MQADTHHVSNDDDIIEETHLPFTWTKLALEKEEEQLGDVELVQAWVVDIPDPKDIATMLRWLKQSGLDRNDALVHLKRIRRQDTLSTLLLDTSPDPPALPPERSQPYLLPIPRHPARTPTSLALKNSFWPTIFCPKRKWEPEPWTHARVRWASDAVRHLKAAYANVVASDRELPIVTYVPLPYRDDDRQLSGPLFGYDTRTSTRHPLRHAVLDVINQVADDRARRSAITSPSSAVDRMDNHHTNGAQYLLTGLSLFVTHEPCLMCTMALLHSRVKEVFYLLPMPRTGGCGGIACVPSLKGVNHRFSIAVWTEDHTSDWPHPLDHDIDV